MAQQKDTDKITKSAKKKIGCKHGGTHTPIAISNGRTWGIGCEVCGKMKRRGPDKNYWPTI